MRAMIGLALGFLMLLVKGARRDVATGEEAKQKGEKGTVTGGPVLVRVRRPRNSIS